LLVGLNTVDAEKVGSTAHPMNFGSRRSRRLKRTRLGLVSPLLTANAVGKARV